MKPHIKIQVVQLLDGALVLLGIIFLIQITLPSTLSFSNNVIDNLFRFGRYIVAICILSCVVGRIVLSTKRHWIRVISAIVGIPFGFLFLVTIPILSGGLFANSPKYYFLEKDGYHYYVTSERYWAFQGSRELKFYKERSLFIFVKERFNVPEEELRALGIDPYRPSEKLWELYGR
jgi:hypothetical protein